MVSQIKMERTSKVSHRHNPIYSTQLLNIFAYQLTTCSCSLFLLQEQISSAQDVHSGRRNGALYGRKQRFTALIFTLFHRNPSVRITTAVSCYGTTIVLHRFYIHFWTDGLRPPFPAVHAPFCWTWVVLLNIAHYIRYCCFFLSHCINLNKIDCIDYLKKVNLGIRNISANVHDNYIQKQNFYFLLNR